MKQNDQRYKVEPIGKVKPHPQNPRKGELLTIGNSIDVNGFYGAVTVQKSTGYILAGNHRYLAAVEQGAEKIPVIWLDVDDEAALRILLVDNRSSDLGGYDEKELQGILDGLEDLEGTGYEGLAGASAAKPSKKGKKEDVPDDKYEPSYGVIVLCDDEKHQEKVFCDLQRDGHKVRVVAV